VAISILFIGLLGFAGLQYKFPPVDGYRIKTTPDARFGQLDPWVHSALLDETRPVSARYEDLFRYFIAGFLAYRSEDGAYAFYPGAPSTNGRQVDGLEGFARTAPLIAAWLHGGRERMIEIPELGEVDLLALLRDGVTAGTDPSQDSYWGDIGLRNQRVVEAADIALALWLTKEQLWSSLDEPTRANIAAWLAQTEGKSRGARHANWRLFPMVVNRVLNDLGMPASDKAFDEDWQVVKASYAGDGWFRDGEHSGFDYYNAWSFHYALHWLSLIDPQLETDFIDRARGEFVQSFRYFITPRGLPIYGRSICYRTAATAPLIIAANRDPNSIAPGEARRALDRVWRYFVNRGALTDGMLTQGYCEANMQILDRYSGPGSCLWGTRSLIAAFMVPPDAPLWTDPELPLPVEQADFEMTIDAAQLRLTGNRETGVVTVRKLDHHGAANPRLKPDDWRRRAAEWVFMRPFRPANRRAKYNAAEYSSDPVFCGCLEPGGTSARVPGYL
jgi:hypothetical protein